MKNMNGWIKLHRKVFENPTVTRSPEHLAVWMYLLCHAVQKPYKVVFAGREIELQPGQLITSRQSIANSTKCKIHESSVQRILKCFENAHQIEQQKSNRNRLITVKNWDVYQKGEQQNEHQANNRRTASEQQANTNKENKEDKEIKESSSAKDFKNMSIEEAWEIMNRRNRVV